MSEPSAMIFFKELLLAKLLIFNFLMFKEKCFLPFVYSLFLITVSIICFSITSFIRAETYWINQTGNVTKTCLAKCIYYISANTAFERNVVDFSISWPCKVFNQVNFGSDFEEVEIDFKQVFWLANWHQKLTRDCER